MFFYWYALEKKNCIYDLILKWCEALPDIFVNGCSEQHEPPTGGQIEI